MADWPEMIYSEWGHAATAAKMSRNKCEGRGGGGGGTYLRIFSTK